MTLQLTEGAHPLVDADVDHALDTVGGVCSRLVPELQLALFSVCLVRYDPHIASLLPLVVSRNEIIVSRREWSLREAIFRFEVGE